MPTVASPDSKVHGANMGPTWVLSAPDGSHVGSMLEPEKWGPNLQSTPTTQQYTPHACSVSSGVGWDCETVYNHPASIGGATPEPTGSRCCTRRQLVFCAQ